MSETTRRRVKTLKTVLESSRWELFEKNKILKIGQELVILVHFEVVTVFSTSEYSASLAGKSKRLLSFAIKPEQFKVH